MYSALNMCAYCIFLLCGNIYCMVCSLIWYMWSLYGEYMVNVWYPCGVYRMCEVCMIIF